MSEKQFPAGMEPLAGRTFTFACHPGVSCYMQCCRNVDMYLYPYDIIRLKRCLGLRSDLFLDRHARIVEGGNPYFPALMLKLADGEEKACPFLGAEGCTVYADRPSACRTYPLERAVDRRATGGRPEDFYFLTSHPYCRGHQEEREWKVRDWLRDQQLAYYNLMDDLWAEMDTLFRSNPWVGEPVAGPKQQLAFMICYNVDGFRDYLAANDLLGRFRLDRDRLRAIGRDDEELLRFGFDFLKFHLAGLPVLRRKI